MKTEKTINLTAYTVEYIDQREPKPRTVYTQTVVLDGGKIIESGTYDELIARNGFFAELVSRQRLDADGE